MNSVRYVIWSNDLDYDDWKDDLEEQYPELSENERIDFGTAGVWDIWKSKAAISVTACIRTRTM